MSVCQTDGVISDSITGTKNFHQKGLNIFFQPQEHLNSVYESRKCSFNLSWDPCSHYDVPGRNLKRYYHVT